MDSMEAEDNEVVSTEVEGGYAFSKEKKLLSQGAEARVYGCVFMGREAVIKERFVKTYRHPDLDRRLTRERIKNEFRATVRCKQAGIDVPTIYFFNTETNGIVYEYVSGITAKNYIEHIRQRMENERLQTTLIVLGNAIGEVIGKMHEVGMTHGDLTTSNIILRHGNPKRICFIDFGLSSNRTSLEDCGTDLYVLEKAIRTTHSNMDFLMEQILLGYEDERRSKSRPTLEKLVEIRLRGRKREMVDL